MSYKVENRLHCISYTVFMLMNLIVSFVGIKLAHVEKISVKLDNY